MKSRSGSKGEGDDRRRCRESGGSGGDEEKASGDRQEVGVLGTADGRVDGQDESAGHQFQGISFFRTHNRHSLVDFSTSYRYAPTCCPTDRVGSRRLSRRRSQGGSDRDGC